MDKKKVAIICRVSTTLDEQLTSLDTQSQLLIERIKQIEEFEFDEATSIFSDQYSGSERL